MQRRKSEACCSEDVYSSCSAASKDTDSYLQDFVRSDMMLERRLKDNGNREKDNYWKFQQQLLKADMETKCNIHKESQMMSGGHHLVGACPQVPAPIITHTAATPQDSPSQRTIDSSSGRESGREFNNRIQSALLAAASAQSSLSIDSIDYSITEGVSRRNSLSPAALLKKDFAPPSSLFQRSCSWKMSRGSLRRKSRTDSEEEQNIVLNNNNHLLSSPMHHVGSELHFHCNGNLIETIRNDTTQRRRSAEVNLRRQGSVSTGNSVTMTITGTSGGESTMMCSPQPQLQRQASIGGYASSIASSPTQLIPSSIQPVIVPKSTSSSVQTGSGMCSHGGDDYRKYVSIDAPLKEGHSPTPPPTSATPPKKIFFFIEPKGCFIEREHYSLYIFPPDSVLRSKCKSLVEQKWFDNAVLGFIALNCITLAMERPNIPPTSAERFFLSSANYVFTAVFSLEMAIKVVATGMFYGEDAYFTSGWNIMDGSLVTVSIIDLLMSLISESSPKIFGILRVFRLLRSLRPLRVINRAPGLKLVVQTLLSSLKPIGNIVLICCTFFIIFGILGVQLFKGSFYYCEGPNIKNVRNKTDCIAADPRNKWNNRKYNFDDLGKALMSLFVLSSKDGWVNIMYTGLDAVGVDQQPIENYNEWRLLYFISFILLVGFFVLNMFVGVVVENFHRCREEQEKEERVRRLAKRQKQMEKKRKRLHEPPYYTNYSKSRLMVHNLVTSKYFDLAIAAVIGLNVITMAMEFYMMPKQLTYALKIFNYFFTAVFILESIMKLVALGVKLYLKDRWNQLDIFIVVLSVVGIALEEMESKIIPINPTIIRVMRVLRIARVLKLLKMAKGIRALLDTVMQALPQVGNLGLLFFLLFFIFAALGVELFGRLECSDKNPCQGLGEHAHFSNFGMAFLTLFRVATGDNWNGIMKDTLREGCDPAHDCVKNCCVSHVIAPLFFVIFVLMAQFVLVNVVVAVLMKHLEESHKQLEEEMDMDDELERELAAEQEEEEEQLCLQMALEEQDSIHRPLAKVLSLPANFTFSHDSNSVLEERRASQSISWRSDTRELGMSRHARRRQTLHGAPLASHPYKYSSVYTTLLDRDKIPANLEYIGQGSEGDIEEIVIGKPTYLDIHHESTELHAHTETREFGESPESSVSPEVILVPPPYSEPGTPSLTEPQPDNKQEKLQVSPGGQRVRIRLCDTRVDSGIGDEKHSQESQPSNTCDPPDDAPTTVSQQQSQPTSQQTVS